MTNEVSGLIEKLYRTHRSKKAVQIAFVDRAIDVTFAMIGRSAVAAEPTTLISSWTHTELVWLGYEISIDSEKYLINIWR